MDASHATYSLEVTACLKHILSRSTRCQTLKGEIEGKLDMEDAIEIDMEMKGNIEGEIEGNVEGKSEEGTP